MTDKTPAQLADDAAEAIRALIHATLSRDDLPYPSDAYDVIGNLAALAYRLPQAIEQVQAAVDRQAESGRMRSDKGEADLPRRLADLQINLATATERANSLADALDMAHGDLGALGYRD